MAYKLFLKSISVQNVANIRDELQKIFAIGRGQASDILNAVPIVLLDDIGDLAGANRMLQKLKPVVDAGAEIVISDKPLEHTPRLRWPELPWFAAEGTSKQPAQEEVLNLAKYNFLVDEREVFRCPSCGEMFLIRHLAPQEKKDALRQAKIAKRLQVKKEAQEVPAAPSQFEEVEPAEEPQLASGAKAPEQEELDLVSFEEGLAALERERGTVGEPARETPQPVSADSESVREAQDFFQELESLPAEESQESAPAVEEELEELAPEEAAKFFEQRTREKPAGHPVPLAQPHKPPVAPQPRRQFGRGPRGGAGRFKPAEHFPAAPELEQPEGYYGLVISQLRTTDKREKAARLMAELTGMPYPDARSICDGIIVNVLRGVSEEEAQNAYQRFKEADIMAKVTLQKRKKRRSGREF